MKLNILLFSVLLLLKYNPLYADGNVHLSGALVSEPCTLPDGSDNIPLNFGTEVDKDLYAHERTDSSAFTIHLADCDPSVLSTVSVTFQGTEETELPGLLAIDPASTAKGIAIGIEGDDGTLLPLSTASPYANLIPGNNDLNFQAFVQATPTAMANKALVVGEFSATATFVLGYQ